MDSSTRLAVVAGVAALGAGVALYMHRQRRGWSAATPTAATTGGAVAAIDSSASAAAPAPAAPADPLATATATTTTTVEHSLALQYPTPEPPSTPETPPAVDDAAAAAAAPYPTTTTRARRPPPLPTLCAHLCERHCAKLFDFNGEDGGEPAALDAACGAGGAAFALADAGFSSVLGVDGEQAHVLAAKQLREAGRLEYALTTTTTAVACVPDGVDRDRVRFWHCATWPGSLPPKLQPVDCVLVADPSRRLPPGGVGSLVSQTVPGLLAPGGVLVVLLGPKGANGGEEMVEEKERPPARADARWRDEVEPALRAALSDGEVELVAEHAHVEYSLGTAAATTAAAGAAARGLAGAAVYVRRKGARRRTTSAAGAGG
jgi:SAM-dependent methyltransferase